MMSHDGLPAGWDEDRVRRVIAHDAAQTEDEAAAEDEHALEESLEIHLSTPPPASFAAWDQRRRITRGGPVSPKFLIEEVTDPDEIARFLAQDERARLN